MAQIIHLIIYVLMFVIAAYGLLWVCQHFKMPDPILWLCGGLLLILILYFIANQLGVPAVFRSP